MTTTTIAAILLAASMLATPPAQESVSVVLGPKGFHDGDVVEITDVTATSPRLEQGDTVTVKGRVRLDSRESARLYLFLTQTEGDGREETDAAQGMKVSKGLAEFELKITIKHRGALHVSFYDEKTGQGFGGVYFGTAEQMKKIEKWKVGDDPSDSPQADSGTHATDPAIGPAPLAFDFAFPIAQRAKGDIRIWTFYVGVTR